MAWTTPKTDWTTGELVTAEDMNAVGENFAALESQRSVVAAYTTTENTERASVDFVDVDSDNINLTLTTSGGDVLVHFEGSVERTHNSTRGSFDIDIDGNRQGGEYGILSMLIEPSIRTVSFTRLIQNLSAGTHIFKIQVKTLHAVSGIRLHAGAQFWVREI